jgi:hypothetical protein
VADRDVLRRHAVARGQRLAQRRCRAVGVGVDGAPERERRRVDRVGMGRLVPVGAGEVEGVDPAQRAAAALVAEGEELLRDLLGRHLLELAVVVAEAHRR